MVTILINLSKVLTELALVLGLLGQAGAVSDTLAAKAASGGDFGAKTAILAEVTAYSNIENGGCDDPDCIMASGKKAYIGAVACPRSIELSTTVIIDGTPFMCEDRTSKKFDGRFDIFMGYGKENYKKAIQFGRQEKQVQVLREGIRSQKEL